MTQSIFTSLLAAGRFLLLDGGMGTMLQAAGMPPGSSPEKFCLDNPDILTGIHRAYTEAGADIITTCTFGANSFKLPPDMDARRLNREMALLAREAVSGGREGKRILIAGDVGPSGLFVKPLGPLEPEDLIAAFAAQIEGLAAGGVDLIFIETQFDLAETRAAVMAARRVCDLPVMASMTFEHGVSLTGSSPEIFAETMQNLGADAIGTNCSLGPDEMLPVVEELLSVCSVPVMAEPNAGLPELRDGRTIFPQTAQAFAAKTVPFASMGAQILGGCCGTTPEHIRALRKALDALDPAPKPRPLNHGLSLTSRSRLVRIAPGEPFALVGERINPTGKPKLASELQKGEFGEALRLADEQLASGAVALDVNVGAHLVDEARLLPELASLLVGRQLAPLSLDSSSPAAIEAAIPYCPGSCLVNSISGEGEKLEILAPLCRDSGSPFVLLPLSGPSLPARASERIGIVEKLLEKLDALRVPRRLVLVDILALAVSSVPEAGAQALEMARWCASQALPCTIGLSNISFGLPARALLNSVFLCLAAGAGLNSCIANPAAPGLREALDAINALLGHDIRQEKFIEAYAGWQASGQASRPKNKTGEARDLYEAVLKGDRERISGLLEKELAAGRDPLELVDRVLIPAINEVGARYERREYFLPQLIRSAETMQAAFALLKPKLEAARGPEKRPVVVMATVEGDIHDIGKNIVCLLLGNHGFDVVDAGKDVPARDIIACAESHNASIIGLSALMTTTMTRMKETIDLAREKKLPVRIMVGGAAVTREFADSIGADAYCGDAVEAARAARALVSET